MTVAASSSCGRYRTKYGSQVVEPAGGQRDDSRPSPDASQRGPSATACATTCSRSSATVARRRPVRVPLLQPDGRPRRATTTTAEPARSSAAQRRRASAPSCDRGAERVREQQRLARRRAPRSATPSAAVRTTYPRARGRTAAGAGRAASLRRGGWLERGPCRSVRPVGSGMWSTSRSACGTPSTSSPGRAARAGVRITATHVMTVSV